MKTKTLIFFTLIVLLGKYHAFAQLEPQNRTDLVLEMDLSYENDGSIDDLTEISNEGKNEFSNDKKVNDNWEKKKSKTQSTIKDYDIKTEAGNLVIELKLEDIDKGYYHISLDDIHLSNSNGQEIRVFPELVYGDVNKRIFAPENIAKITFAFGNDLESIVSFTGRFELTLSIVRYSSRQYKTIGSPIICEDGLPKFGLKKYLIHGIPIATSGVFYYLGYRQQQQAEEKYNIKYLGQSTSAAAESHYIEVLDHENKSKTFNWIGNGINIANGLWLVGRYIIHLDRRDTYRKNCEGIVQINPYYINEMTNSNSCEQYGLVLNYKF